MKPIFIPTKHGKYQRCQMRPGSILSSMADVHISNANC